jgi:hypothetical protein
VVKILEDSDFSLETTPILDLRSSNSLDGTLLSCLSMCANRDFSISSFTDVLFLSFVDRIDVLFIFEDHGRFADDQGVVSTNHLRYMCVIFT